MKRVFLSLTLLVIFVISFAAEPVKILAIGNSFSQDAIEQYFHEICVSQGVDVIVANMYIGGCSIERHYDNTKTDAPDYRYRKISVDGTMVQIDSMTLQKALVDEKWDYISFQQASHDSGIYKTYKPLPALMSYVRSIVGEHPIFMWHMTWAYSDNATHPGYVNYDKSRKKMYEAIVEAGHRVMSDYPQLRIIIPCGTAVENGRLLIDDNPGQLTRDGYHMSYTTGRYIAAATWYSAIFRRIIDSQSVFYPVKADPTLKLPALEAATSAIISPYAPIQIK